MALYLSSQAKQRQNRIELETVGMLVAGQATLANDYTDEMINTLRKEKEIANDLGKRR